MKYIIIADNGDERKIKPLENSFKGEVKPIWVKCGDLISFLDEYEEVYDFMHESKELAQALKKKINFFVFLPLSDSDFVETLKAIKYLTSNYSEYYSIKRISSAQLFKTSKDIFVYHEQA